MLVQLVSRVIIVPLKEWLPSTGNSVLVARFAPLEVLVIQLLINFFLFMRYVMLVIILAPVGCPDGTRNLLVGQISSSICEPCPAGYYCYDIGNSNGKRIILYLCYLYSILIYPTPFIIHRMAVSYWVFLSGWNCFFL
jgi:hypothetical protein